MDTQKVKKGILFAIPTIMFGYAGDKLAFAWRITEGTNISEKLFPFFTNLGVSFANPAPSLHPIDLFIGLALGILIQVIMHFKRKNAKKFRHGEEYGAARWGTPKDIEPYMDKSNFENNIILTQTERLTMGKPSSPKYARNKNVLVIGGSGSGKTRFFLKPNLMQMHSSYVVTDPKGTVLVECGKMLQRNKYQIRVFNTVDFKKSMHYNPFAYIRPETREQDILKFVEVLIKNTSGSEQKGEDFWTKAERLLYTAYITMMYTVSPPEEWNFATLIDMINCSECREEDETFQNAIDIQFSMVEKWLNQQLDEEENLGEFEAMREISPTKEQMSIGSFAVKQYKAYKLAAGKTAKSILISCSARLSCFSINSVLDITAYDEMQLDKIGDRKTALFIIISDTDATFNFLVAMLYTQMFNLLCTKADNNPDGSGKLKHHVRCLLDEFANIGQIPDFDKLIATIRSREISACIILQAQSQLKAIYKDNADTIVGNCDSTLFLGGKEKSTLKEISESLGKETIDDYDTSRTRGQSESYGMNYKKLGKELMSQDDLNTMDGSKCILQVRGVRPFFSRKYDITKHKRYPLLMDSNPQNMFDIASYIKRKREKNARYAQISPDEPIETFQATQASSEPEIETDVSTEELDFI